MYVHSYQIHNVLNVYRKQLSQKIGSNGAQSQKQAVVKEQVNVSDDGQRQAIMDKVSADIVDKIARRGAENRFEETQGQYLNHSKGRNPDLAETRNAEFTYTVIDENNNKKINVLPVNKFAPWFNSTGAEAHEIDE